MLIPGFPQSEARVECQCWPTTRSRPALGVPLSAPRCCLPLHSRQNLAGPTLGTRLSRGDREYTNPAGVEAHRRVRRWMMSGRHCSGVQTAGGRVFGVAARQAFHVTARLRPLSSCASTWLLHCPGATSKIHPPRCLESRARRPSRHGGRLKKVAATHLTAVTWRSEKRDLGHKRAAAEVSARRPRP